VPLRDAKVVILAGVFLLMPHLGWADVITIWDQSESAFITVSPLDATRVVPNGLNQLCGEETCEGIVSSPSPGATIVASDILRSLTSGIIQIAEPNAWGGSSGYVSDYFTSDVELGASLFKFGFGSDSTTPLAQCSPCSIIENGKPQLVGTVVWSDGTIDTLLVASDVEPKSVPEPSSGLLLAFGAGALAFLSRPRQASACAATSRPTSSASSHASPWCKSVS